MYTGSPSFLSCWKRSVRTQWLAYATACRARRGVGGEQGGKSELSAEPRVEICRRRTLPSLSLRLWSMPSPSNLRCVAPQRSGKELLERKVHMKNGNGRRAPVIAACRWVLRIWPVPNEGA